MKTIKTNFRSKLYSKNLSNLMVVALHSATIERFDPIPSLNHFFDMKDRRMAKEAKEGTGSINSVSVEDVPATPATEMMLCESDESEESEEEEMVECIESDSE